MNGQIINNQTSTKQTKARSNKETVEGAENISAMKENGNMYNDVPGSFKKAASAVHASRE